jgi:DNA-binding transcriptional MocR family regulator
VAALRAELPAWNVPLPAGGLSLWIELDAPISTALAGAAPAQGLRLGAGSRFGADATFERWIRLPFTLRPEQLVDAARRLAVLCAGSLAEQQPLRAQLVM